MSPSCLLPPHRLRRARGAAGASEGKRRLVTVAARALHSLTAVGRRAPRPARHSPPLYSFSGLHGASVTSDSGDASCLARRYL